MPMLEVEGLEAGYGRSLVLHGVSFEVRQGDFVCVLGANGAGKTTLLKVLSGIIPAASGDMRLNGQSLRYLRPNAIVKAGMCHVPEGRHIFPELTVRDNLRVGSYTLRPREAARSIDSVLARLPLLARLSTRLAGYLSGGEQQQLAIGRALVAQPKLLLLDEPTLGLSPLAIREVEAVLLDLNKEAGVTILAVEQNVHSALRYADRAMVVESGEIALQGEAKSLLQSEEVVRAYIGV